MWLLPSAAISISNNNALLCRFLAQRGTDLYLQWKLFHFKALLNHKSLFHVQYGRSKTPHHLLIQTEFQLLDIVFDLEYD